MHEGKSVGEGELLENHYVWRLPAIGRWEKLSGISHSDVMKRLIPLTCKGVLLDADVVCVWLLEFSNADVAVGCAACFVVIVLVVVFGHVKGG